MKTLKYILIAFLLVGQVSCIDNKFNDEFKISITPDAVVSKIDIEVLNENGDVTSFPEATISFSGENADKVYTPAGKKEFNTLDGTLSFGITSDLSPTVEEPVVVNMKIEAPGYDTLEQEVAFTGDNENARILTFSMRKTGELPPGSKMVSITKALGDNNELISDFTLESEAIGEEQTVLDLEANTTFLDEDGLVISGNEVQLDLQTFNADATNIEDGTFDSPLGLDISGIPDGGLIIEDGGFEQKPDDLEATAKVGFNSVLKTSKTAATESSRYLLPLGSPYCFYLYVNGRRVYSLSREVKVKTYFYGNRDVFNPATGTRAVEGDVVEVYRRVYRWYRSWWWWSYRVSYVPTGKTGVVKKDAYNRWYVEYPTSYTGVHYFGFTGENINTCSVEDFSYTVLQNDGRPTYYYFLFTDANNNYLGSQWSYISQSMYISQGALKYSSYYRHFKKLVNSGVKLKIYGYNWTDRRYEKVYDQETSICDLSGQTLNVKTSECAYNYNLEMAVDCPDVNIVFNNTPIYYRKQGDYWFTYYKSIYGGHIRGYGSCFDDNTSYEFRLRYDGEWYTSAPVLGKDVKEASIDFNTQKVCDIIDESL